MGPGGSCTRMVDRILEGRPHVARSICLPGQDEVSLALRMVAQLIAERAVVDPGPLFAQILPEESERKPAPGVHDLVMEVGRKMLEIPVPERPASPRPPATSTPEFAPAPPETGTPSMAPILEQHALTETAHTAAHEAYLRLSRMITGNMARVVEEQNTLLETMVASGGGTRAVEEGTAAFPRSQCLSFAIGTIAEVLGPDFAEIDSFPTRVRLPDEPLMLVDRILSVEGEARSLTSGTIITEHDVLPGGWYLDNHRIPTGIAVEAGQADLFLSGYLGIDFRTRGLAMYRLLDAVVTFHRSLPEEGEKIRYEISIDHFFRQGDTHLFRFNFEATVNGDPLLTMREGCAGFFTSGELDAGQGLVHTALDRRPMTGKRPEDWKAPVPMVVEAITAEQIHALRAGDLPGCFGPAFTGLNLEHPLTLPTEDRLNLIHRVTRLDPEGGRFGLGLIRAETDIHPDDWFLTCHFVDDQVMPGTLMYESSLHVLRIFLLRMGWVAEAAEAVWEPVPGVASRLRCRGQVIESTGKAAYEVTIKELGYRPEPYALADTVMYSDNRAIVEMTDMSIRLTGLTRDRVREIWSRRTVSPRPVLFDHDRILAFAVGKPSEAFGEAYRVFDQDRFIARLPGPPFQFLDRITRIENAEALKMCAGGMIEAEYDVPPDAWYFESDRQDVLPYTVLLEVALQASGWLAAYLGSALSTDADLKFRNLGGTATQHDIVPRNAGTLTTRVSITQVSRSGDMIIQNYDFEVRKAGRVVYSGDTYFGFFTPDALGDQVGIRDAELHIPSKEEVASGEQFEYPCDPPYPDRKFRTLERIDLYIPEGGPEGKGFLRGSTRVNPEAWFFKAHFLHDPVWPGSLGLESLLQLLKVVAGKRWGAGPVTRFESPALGETHQWVYRGQVTPRDSRVTVEARITHVDDETRLVRADGFLMIDGRIIYRMTDFGLRMATDRP